MSHLMMRLSYHETLASKLLAFLWTHGHPIIHLGWFGWLLNLTKNIQRCGLWVRPLNELLTKMASWKVNIHVNFQTQLLVHIKLEIRVCSLDFNVAGFWCKVQSSWLSKGFMSDFMLQWTKTLFMLL